MPYLALALCICIPIVVLTIHFRFPRNIVTSFLIPRFLSKREYPKHVFRQAGTGSFVFSAWLLMIIYAIASNLPKDGMDNNLWLMGIIAFAMPIISIMSLFIAIYYLSIGIFSKSKKITPGFQSFFATDADQLDLYMKRLRRYTKINIATLVLAISIPVTEAVAGIEPQGIVILINVAFLITFIMTTWRVRNYLVKSATAMGQSGKDILVFTLGNAFFMVLFVCPQKKV